MLRKRAARSMKRSHVGTRHRSEVTRAEFEQLCTSVDECRRTMDTQFKRIAQLQAELDEVRKAWEKMQSPPNSRR